MYNNNYVTQLFGDGQSSQYLYQMLGTRIDLSHTILIDLNFYTKITVLDRNFEKANNGFYKF